MIPLFLSIAQRNIISYYDSLDNENHYHNKEMIDGGVFLHETS